MSELEQIQQQGFTLKPVDAGVYIEPIDSLTGKQRQWIIEHKPEIRRRLLAQRWEWFLSIAREHGVHPDVVAAEFPAPDDILDVIEQPEHNGERLRECMATLCCDPKILQRQRDYESGRWVPINQES